MFTKLKTLKKFSKETISIDKLYDIIKNKKDARIDRLRSVEYKSPEYNKIKLSLPCILPTGIFTGLKNSDLQLISGYLYYDIDNTTDDTIKILNDTFPITLSCKSVGGRGISFLVRVKNLNIDNYYNVYTHIRNELKNAGFNIDMAASGMARKMIISSDENCYFNKNAYWDIDVTNFEVNGTQRLDDIFKSEKNIDNFNYTIIPEKELLKEIKTESSIDDVNFNRYIINDISYHRVLIPNEIKDGSKHTIYTRIINSLFYLNPNITNQQLISFLYHINLKATPPMKIDRLKQIAEFVSSSIRNGGSIKVKTRIKKIHFNMKENLSPKEKQILAAKINGALKTNKTIDLINSTIDKLLSMNIEPTQKRVVEETGLSLRTIKRNWNKEKIDINKFDINNNIIEEISFNDFFSKNSDNSEI